MARRLAILGLFLALGLSGCGAATPRTRVVPITAAPAAIEGAAVDGSQAVTRPPRAIATH